jgi:hypothetical protein
MFQKVRNFLIDEHAGRLLGMPLSDYMDSRTCCRSTLKPTRIVMITIEQVNIMAEQAQQEKHKIVIIYHEKPAEIVLKRFGQKHPNLEIIFYYGATVATDVPERKLKIRPRPIPI